MKGSGKIICGILSVSFLMLLYVHGETSLFSISYGIDAKSKQLAKVSEEYRRLRFEVEQLKAPLVLENKMKEMSLELMLPSDVRVIRVPQMPAGSQPQLRDENNLPGFSNSLFRALGRWVDIAQAKTDR